MGAGSPGPAPGPLAALGRRLRQGPPSLRHLLVRFGAFDDYAQFLRLVREYTPEIEAEVLGRDLDRALEAFAQAFRERYFPLEHLEDYIGEPDGLEVVMSRIPAHFLGLSWDDYDGLDDYKTSHILASLLVAFEAEVDLGSGVRVTLLEVAVKKVPQEILARIPQGGYPREFLEEELAGTPYQGLIVHARWLCHDTGCDFLDMTGEDEWEMSIDWTRENVEALTAAWQHFLALDQETNDFFDWMEEDLVGHLKELLNFLEGRSGYAKDPRQLELPLGVA